MTITFLPPTDIEALDDAALPDPRLTGKVKMVRLDGGSRREQTNSDGSLVSQCAADIAAEKINWLWPGRLARGKLTCIAGEPGAGKSQLTIAIAAAVTTGGEWPCGEGRAARGNVIMLSAEDGPADTIKPRLLAAGADAGRVHIVSAVREGDGARRAFDLQRDIEALRALIAATANVALVIIDPISAYLGGRLDSHRNSDVRGVLAPLAEMGERTGAAILSVTHLAKASASGKALHRVIGSIAFTAAPRAAFLAIEDAEHEGRRLLLPIKNNLARAPQGLAYRLTQCFVGDGDILTSHVVWDAEPVTITANEALAADAAGTEGRTALDEAKDFLREALAAGLVSVDRVKTNATAAGLSWATVRRAKAALNVQSVHDADMAGGWSWRLP